jgi:hypothetical protein
MIRWEPAPYKPEDRIADVKSGRLHVKRSRKGARTFDGYFNGCFLGCWDTRDMAMSKVATMFVRGDI